MPDIIDRWIARTLRRAAEFFDPTPLTPPRVTPNLALYLVNDQHMTYRRYEIEIASADLVKGSWTATVQADGLPPFTLPVVVGASFRVPADRSFTYYFTLTDPTGLPYQPSPPLTVAAHPTTPTLSLRFVGFEEVAGTPFARVVSAVDDPSLKTI
jgi:hypothetical protein